MTKLKMSIKTWKKDEFLMWLLVPDRLTVSQRIQATGGAVVWAIFLGCLAPTEDYLNATAYLSIHLDMDMKTMMTM